MAGKMNNPANLSSPPTNNARLSDQRRHVFHENPDPIPPMKIQPIDIDSDSQRLKEAAVIRNDSAKPVLKSRLRRLFVFDRQFPSVVRTSSSSSEKPIAACEAPQSNNKDGGGTEFEPSSVCLAKMVQSFMEESNEKQQQQQPPGPKCGRNRCNCFNSNTNDSSDEELDVIGGGGLAESTTTDTIDLLKSLIPCTSVAERNLLADTAKIVDKNSKEYKRKDDLKKIVTDGLSSLGYDSSFCKSKWDKTSSYPAGEYDFIDAIIEGERFLIDVDFRSEFEIARSTGTYKAILQSLPFIFVGKSERLRQIVSIVSEAAKQSLKKKGMHVPPWRKAEYILAKWLSPSCVRTKQPPSPSSSVQVAAGAAVPEMSFVGNDGDGDAVTKESDCGELELIFSEKTSLPEPEDDSGGMKMEPAMATPAWKPPAVKPKSVERGAKVLTGLAPLLKDKP